MHLDPTVFLTVDGWITLLTLTFLEIVLGVDNLVFIAITSNRLVPEKQHIGRRLGLLGAMFMRICLLFLITAIMQLTKPLFVIPMIRIGGAPLGISARDLILLCGGVYLVFKGIVELRDKLALTEERAQLDPLNQGLERISLPRAVATIMIMDIIFSLDSVITAAGVSGQLLVMVPAVIIAVCVMIVFADPISDFINRHAEMKILALTFITLIGLLLVTEGLHLELGIEILGMGVEKLVIYFAMIFAVILEAIQMRYNKNLRVFQAELLAEDRLMHKIGEHDTVGAAVPTETVAEARAGTKID